MTDMMTVRVHPCVGAPLYGTDINAEIESDLAERDLAFGRYVLVGCPHDIRIARSLFTDEGGPFSALTGSAVIQFVSAQGMEPSSLRLHWDIDETAVVVFRGFTVTDLDYPNLW